MATLQKIRSHGALVLLIVGAAMLAFIIGDFLNSGAAFFSRSRETVGEIAGNTIRIQDFEKSVAQLTEVYKIESGRQDFDENTYSQIRQQAWQEQVSAHSLDKLSELVGMRVTASELIDLCIGENPSPLLRGRRAFADETGQYNPAVFRQFYTAVHDEEAQDNPQVQQYLNYWSYWENAIKVNHLQQKFVSVLNQSIVANKLDAKAAFDDRATSKNVQFVESSFISLNDSTLKVSDTEVRKLYNQRKDKQYKQDPNRAIKYIAFPVVPSEEDFAEVKAVMDGAKEEFTNISEEELASFVNANSDVLYDGKNYSKTTVPDKYKDFAFSAKAGEVTDILFADNTYSMARLVENGFSLPDSVKLRYIYLQQNDQAQIDSIMTAVKKGAKFEDLVAQYQGEADAEKIGWLTEQTLPADLAASAFHTPLNGMFTYPAGLGIQLFQVVELTKPTPKAKLAIFERQVKASSKTYGAIYNKAREFVTTNDSEDAFETAAEEQSLTLASATHLTKNQEQVNGMPQSRKVVRWAFEAKRGQVSDIFECGSQIVVAVLTEVNESEFRPLQDVQAELQAELLNDKKAEKLIAKMSGAESLSALAESLGTSVQTADNVRLSSGYFGPAGQEPKLVGKAFELAENQLSAPVKGNRGVFVLNVVSTSTEDTAFDEKKEIESIAQRYQRSFPQYGMFSVAERCLNWATENEVEVVDNRANFY